MSIITIATSKGGGGKTTIAQVLLGTLAGEGYKVAAIDADFNQTLATWVEVFAQYPIECRAELDETKLVAVAGELEEVHDLVVIDTAGSAVQLTVFAIGCADLVIIPIQPSSADVVEAIKTLNLVKSASEMARRDIMVRVLLTDYQPNTNVSVHTEGEVAKYELPVLRSRLNRLVAFKEMTFTGQAPGGGSAGSQVWGLLLELKELGALPFLRS